MKLFPPAHRAVSAILAVLLLLLLSGGTALAQAVDDDDDDGMDGGLGDSVGDLDEPGEDGPAPDEDGPAPDEDGPVPDEEGPVPDEGGPDVEEEPPAGGTETNDVNLVGRAFSFQQDTAVPLEAHVGRVPMARTELTQRLVQGFAAFYDPGLLGRFAFEDTLADVDEESVRSPSWVGCAVPESPATPRENERSAAEQGPTATALCDEEGTEIAAHHLDTTGLADDVLSAEEMRAETTTRVDPDGGGTTTALSVMERVEIGDALSFDRILSRVEARSTDDPEESEVDVESRAVGVELNGEPIEADSASFEDVAEAINDAADGLEPALEPLGMQVEAKAEPAQTETEDGDRKFGARGRASQLLITVQQEEATVTYGLGYAEAAARTVEQPDFDPDSGDFGAVGELDEEPETADGAGPVETAPSDGSMPTGEVASPDAPDDAAPPSVAEGTASEEAQASDPEVAGQGLEDDGETAVSPEEPEELDEDAAGIQLPEPLATALTAILGVALTGGLVRYMAHSMVMRDVSTDVT